MAKILLLALLTLSGCVPKIYVYPPRPEPKVLYFGDQASEQCPAHLRPGTCEVQNYNTLVCCGFDGRTY